MVKVKVGIVSIKRVTKIYLVTTNARKLINSRLIGVLRSKVYTFQICLLGRSATFVEMKGQTLVSQLILKNYCAGVFF